MMTRGHYSDGVGYGDAPFIAIGAGKVPGVSVANVQSFVTGVSQVGQDLVDWVDTYVFPSDSGVVMQVTSSNVADVGIPIAVVGLDADFNEKVEIVVLNGTTPVVTGIFTRINLMDVQGAVAVQGTISIANGADIYCQILPSNQVSRMGIYSTPAGKSSQILSILGSMTKSAGNADDHVAIDFLFRQLGGVFKKTFSFGLQRRGSTTVVLEEIAPRQLPGAIDIKLRGTASAINIDISVRLGVLLQDTR